jgi:predicted methyltransferase
LRRRILFRPAIGIAIDKYNVDNYQKEIPYLEDYIIQEIKKSRTVYFYNKEASTIYPVERRERGYKALIAPGPNMPYTLDINGIHMHRIKEIDPYHDSELKVRAAKVNRSHRVLDTCMGLGYTAIKSAEKGATVVTVEKDSDIVWIAEHNPYSLKLASENVEIIQGDITEVIKNFPENSFDRIIHDPPRLTPATGDLYGLEFYKELYRVLKPGGIIFHYTGLPGRKKGLNLIGKTAARLEKAGFYPTWKNTRAQGVVAVKPPDT